MKASPCCSQRRDEPSMSVNNIVTTPVGILGFGFSRVVIKALPISSQGDTTVSPTTLAFDIAPSYSCANIAPAATQLHKRIPSPALRSFLSQFESKPLPQC